MSMTKKDFVVLANALYEAKPSFPHTDIRGQENPVLTMGMEAAWKDTLDSIIAKLRLAYPHFNPRTFRAYAEKGPLHDKR